LQKTVGKFLIFAAANFDNFGEKSQNANVDFIEVETKID